MNGTVPTMALLNGSQTISASGIDPFRLAGDRDNVAISVMVTATASGGHGIALALVLEYIAPFGPMLR